MINMKLSYKSMNIVYTVSGSGPDVIFIHGWAGSRLHWSQASSQIINRRLWALDMIGFGDSDNPIKNMEITDHVELISHFISKQNIKNLVLVGHSMGGQVAANYTITHSSSVSRIILIEATVGEELRKLTMPILLIFGAPETTIFNVRKNFKTVNK